jgi:hypothetical protein
MSTSTRSEQVGQRQPIGVPSDGSSGFVAPSDRSDVFLATRPGGSLLVDVVEARLGLTKGLQSTEMPDGWRDPSAERAQYIWTSMIVCRTLLRAGVSVGNLKLVLKTILSKRFRRGEIAGWESAGSPGAVATFVTRSAGSLFLQVGALAPLSRVIKTFRLLQNRDGGWGVFDGDTESKVRATSFVLSFLAECLEAPLACEFVNIDMVTRALNWLDAARTQSGGRANLAGTPPENLSATAIALDALLVLERLKRRRPELGITLRPQRFPWGLSD